MMEDYRPANPKDAWIMFGMLCPFVLGFLGLMVTFLWRKLKRCKTEAEPEPTNDENPVLDWKVPQTIEDVRDAAIDRHNQELALLDLIRQQNDKEAFDTIMTEVPEPEYDMARFDPDATAEYTPIPQEVYVGH